jgi:chemotaxis protein MotB
MAKKKHHEEHENLERWLVSYADFITLLFAFFTILYALSQTDKAKYKQAIESIQRAFQSSGGVFPLKGSPFTPYDRAPDKGTQTPTLDSGRMSKSEQAALEKIAEQVRGIFERTTGLSSKDGDVEVVRSAEGFKIRLGEALLFKPGSDKLNRSQIPFLFEMGKRLAALELPIQIEGHSDGIEANSRNLAAQNNAFGLSLNRSYNMVRFLVEGANFPKNKISLAGFGDAQPIAANDSPEGRAKNRRVEISVITPDHEVKELAW